MGLSFVFAFFLVFVSSSYAGTVSSLDSPISAADTVNIIITANPPLSTLNYKEGASQLTVQPTYYKGTSEFAGLNEDNFSGGAFSFNFTKILKENWGWYFNGVFFQYSSNHIFDGVISTTTFSDVKINYFTLNPGLHYKIFENEGYRPSVILMGGPYLKISRFSQGYKKVGGFVSGTFTNSTVYDFDIESNPNLLGAVVGARLSWKVYEKFAINAFGFLQIPFTDTCQSYKITALRTDLEGNSDQSVCSGGSGVGVDFRGTENIFGQANTLSGGFNLEYLPWQVTVNISAPIIRRLTQQYNDMDVTIISFSKSFNF